jgi:hypothetical protein
VLLRYKQTSIFVVRALKVSKLMWCQGSTLLSSNSSSDKVVGLGSSSTRVPSLLLSGSERRDTTPEKIKFLAKYSTN